MADEVRGVVLNFDEAWIFAASREGKAAQQVVLAWVGSRVPDAHHKHNACFLRNHRYRAALANHFLELFEGS